MPVRAAKSIAFVAQFQRESNVVHERPRQFVSQRSNTTGHGALPTTIAPVD
jgi:hypothetical protein